ncbi:hypothetical protein JD844_004058, partial [Phrynosoma platyrhinos]
YCPEPKTEADCIGNIKAFLNGCAALKVEVRATLFIIKSLYTKSDPLKALLRRRAWEPGCSGMSFLIPVIHASSFIFAQLFDAHDLYMGDNFPQVLNTLAAINKATEDQQSTRPCSQQSSPRSPAGDCPPSMQAASPKSPRTLRRQSKAVEMTENGNHQLVVRARFHFKQTNEDELSINKGDIIYVTRVEEGGWWEGTLNGKTGWFPSNYVREIKSTDKPLSPKGLKNAESPQLTKNYYAVAATLSYPGPYLMVSLSSSDELEKFMELQGATCSGILTLTMSLSKPFTRLDKYISLLQELERHMEETHPDHEDVLKAVTSFKTLVSQCQEMRKRKQLELQILSESIQGWEGDDIKSMGNVLYMSQVMVQYGGSEGKLPLIGMVVTKLEDVEGAEHAFEISGQIFVGPWEMICPVSNLALSFLQGGMIDRITVHCSSSHDLHEWLDHLQRLPRGTASSGTLSKTHSWSSHSVSSHVPHGSLLVRLDFGGKKISDR